jgi:hypothetical protein
MSWRGKIPIHPAADLFPLIDEAEKLALGQDIVKNGLASPIGVTLVKNNPTLIDGRNRLDAMEAVGLRVKLERTINGTWKLLVEEKLEDGRWVGKAIAGQAGATVTVVPADRVIAYIASVNLHRRNMTMEQRRDLAAALFKEDPAQSNRAVAALVKIDHKTAGSIRQELERRGEIPHVDKVVDSKGRQQPTSRPKASEPVTEPTEPTSEATKETGEAKETTPHHAASVARLVTEAPPKPIETAAETSPTMTPEKRFLNAFDNAITEVRFCLNNDDGVLRGHLANDETMSQMVVEVYEALIGLSVNAERDRREAASSRLRWEPAGDGGLLAGVTATTGYEITPHPRDNPTLYALDFCEDGKRSTINRYKDLATAKAVAETHAAEQAAREVAPATIATDTAKAPSDGALIWVESASATAAFAKDKDADHMNHEAKLSDGSSYSISAPFRVYSGSFAGYTVKYYAGEKADGGSVLAKGIRTSEAAKEIAQQHADKKAEAVA